MQDRKRAMQVFGEKATAQVQRDAFMYSEAQAISERG